MSYSSPPAALALLGLRLKGFAPSSQIAALVGVDEDRIDVELSRAASLEQTIYRTGNRTGWALKPKGRIEVERLLSHELDEQGVRLAVRRCYEKFVALNADMLQACTDWQVKDTEARLLNDHADSSYDARVVEQLAVVNAAVQPICADLEGELDRFAIYAPRFSSALVKTQAGDHDWFAAPLQDSYHTVWFELHEDLLATLGIDRASEESP